MSTASHGHIVDTRICPFHDKNVTLVTCSNALWGFRKVLIRMPSVKDVVPPPWTDLKTKVQLSHADPGSWHWNSCNLFPIASLRSVAAVLYR